MTISEHLTEFAGFKVAPWEPGQPLGDPVKKRLSLHLYSSHHQKAD